MNKYLRIIAQKKGVNSCEVWISTVLVSCEYCHLLFSMQLDFPFDMW